MSTLMQERVKRPCAEGPHCLSVPEHSLLAALARGERTRTQIAQLLPAADDLIDGALASGHVETMDGDMHLRLTARGRAALRKHKAHAAATAAGNPTATASPSPVSTAQPGLNPLESPIAWLRRRLDRDGKPMISPEQFEAGERLRTDLWLAGLTPKVTQSWSGIPAAKGGARGAPGGSASMTETLVAARQRVNRALAAIEPEFANLLLDVCGFLKGLEEIETSQSWPQRSAKLMLQTALTALARHYGLLPPKDAETLWRDRLRHSGADDYRPTLDRWRP